MIERMNNADFHKFLTEFSDAVAQGKYKKMPYDKYRTFRNWRNISIDVMLEYYTNLNGERVQRIRISPDDPVGYEFYIDDGSFGNFCYDYLKKKEEPKVRLEEKKQYDIYGNVIEDYHNYQSKSDKIDNAAKEAYYDYCVAKATGDSLNSTNASCVCNTVDTIDCITAGIDCYYDSICTSDTTRATTASITVPSCIDTRTVVDVLQEDIASLKKLVEGNNCEIATKANLSDVNRDIDVLGDSINEINERIDECEYDLRERIEEARTAAIEESWCTRAELEHLLDERIKALEEKYMLVTPADKMMTQSTSSECYPVRNFNLKVDYMPDCDNRKEKENMDTNKMFNFDFGPVASHVRMSPYGLAIASADNKYVSYDKASGNIVDVEVFNFDAQKFLYKMPVPVNQVAVGDIVVHMRKPMFVRSVKDGVVSVVDIYNAEAKDILPVKSPFGFNFMTKIVSLVDMSGADVNSPFGNMLPLLMMGEGKNFKDILPLMLMTGNTGAFGNMTQNPLMLMALMSNGDIDPMIMAMCMGAFQEPVAPTHTCGCGHCHEGGHQDTNG